jgi:hypothetical protein
MWHVINTRLLKVRLATLKGRLIQEFRAALAERKKPQAAAELPPHLRVTTRIQEITRSSRRCKADRSLVTSR